VPKVSIVIPTYNTPNDELTQLVASLDAQTLPADQFEAIYVDDGSTDDTHDRLLGIAASRPHVRVERIENSGWPSKPRNVGIDLAAGEYVLFMDHDDRLYPDGLRAAYEFARENGADVLCGKESYTKSPSWALNTYVGDQAQSLGREDIHPLVPMNPHKLYRREFLREHGIRFPEGRRFFWEDQFFNIAAARHARVISTMSSTPFYHWVFLEDSGTSLFDVTTDDYWARFRQLLEWTLEQLAGERFDLPREQLMRHQYELRVVGVFGAEFAELSDAQRAYVFDRCRAVRTEFGLDRFDAQLSSSRRMRAWCLASGDLAVMDRLCAEDAKVPGTGDAVELVWRDGVLHVSADAHWIDDDGAALALEWDGERSGNRVLRSLSPELAGTIPREARDMTDDVAQAKVELSVRGRADRVCWLTPTTGGPVLVDPPDGSPELSASVTGEIDPDTAAMGGPLTAGNWDVLLRCQIGKSVTHRALRSAVPASVSVTRGRLHLMYPAGAGKAALRPDGAAEALRRLSPVRAMRGRKGRIEIELSGVHDGEGEVETRIGVSTSLAASPAFRSKRASIRVEGGRAFVRFSLVNPVVTVRIGDRAPGAPEAWLLTVADSGEATIVPHRPADAVEVTDRAEARSPERPSPSARIAMPTPSTGRRILVRAGKDPLTPMSAERSLSIRRDGVFGTNAGNMLFYTASWRTLLTDDADLTADGYSTERDPARRTAERINAEYDRLVIPLANAFRGSFVSQLDRLTEVIGRLDVPVTVLGVGAQFGLNTTVETAPADLRDSVRAFVSAVLDRSPSIGVRGETTRDFLRDLGFADEQIDVIGCPSLYGFGGDGSIAARGPVTAASRLAVTYSPYLRDIGPFVREVTTRFPDSYVVPQTVEALALMLWGEPTKYADKSELPETSAHELYRSDRMRFFVDATTWIDALRDRDLVVGTRIHGTIAGLLAGVPSILIAHDSRTRELAQFHAIPYQTKAALRRVDVAAWREAADFDAFTAAHARNTEVFRSFLDRHALGHTLGRHDTRFDRELALRSLAAPVHTPSAGGAAGRRSLSDRVTRAVTRRLRRS
jgi:glycosyltransferase involved in cell wall biosynthesis